jgi:cell shape-determining protein MreC
MNYYVADELANKVWQLHKALNQAEKIVSVLEEENQKLKNLLFLNDNTEHKDTVKIQCVA